MHLNYNFAVQSFGSDPSSEGGGSEHLPPPFFPYNQLSNLTRIFHTKPTATCGKLTTTTLDSDFSLDSMIHTATSSKSFIRLVFINFAHRLITIQHEIFGLNLFLFLLTISTSSLFSAQTETTDLEPIPMMVTPGEFDVFEQELEDIFVNHSFTEEISIFSNLSLLESPKISTSVLANHSEPIIHFSNSPIDLSPIYPTIVPSKKTIPSHKRERESDHAEPDSSSSEQESPNWSFSSEEGNQKRIRVNRPDSSSFED